jgi:hypothetical protein
LSNKVNSTHDGKLASAFEHYLVYRKIISGLSILDKKSVHEFVDATNDYREKVLKTFEERPNSGQENLRSTILEEFFQHLFKDIIRQRLPKLPESFYSGRADSSYVGLSFTPKSFKDVFSDPNPYIHTKDQDFVLGCLTKISVSAQGCSDDKKFESSIVIPVVAIECKTYIERNMLDSCAATARRLKVAMPYCLFLVVSEYLKMEDAYPELTDIDEVYVLCKATNGERLDFAKRNLPPHPIDKDLVFSLYGMVRKHINRIWWSPSDALQRGMIIGRP